MWHKNSWYGFSNLVKKTKLGSDILSFIQKGGENLYQTWNKIKYLLLSCPQKFYLILLDVENLWRRHLLSCLHCWIEFHNITLSGKVEKLRHFIEDCSSFWNGCSYFSVCIDCINAEDYENSFQQRVNHKTTRPN